MFFFAYFQYCIHAHIFKEEGSKKGLKCGYVIYEWPRRDMKAGEEVFCSYDYKLDDAPPWYQDLWSNRICKLYKQQKVFWYLVIHILEIKEIYFILKTNIKKIIRGHSITLWTKFYSIWTPGYPIVSYKTGMQIEIL